MRVEPLRAQDATLWCAQAPDAPLQIGAVCLFEAGPLLDETGAVRIDELHRHVLTRLHDAPRFRQRLVTIPFDQGRPVWVDDVGFDIARHVRCVALPRPGSEAQLRDFVARLIEVPLDTSRPLWEIWIVEGVADDRIAVIPKVSHVMADGMAVLGFAISLLDPEPRRDVGEPPPWTPDPPPGPIRLLADAILGRAQRQTSVARRAAQRLADPLGIIGRAAALVRAGVSSVALASRLPITRPVGGHRDFAWVRLPLADLMAVKRAEGVTLNDVVLAISAGALRHYLERAGVAVQAIRPRVLVPVSAHGTNAAGEIENRFSLMLADLPVAIADPLERLRAVHTEMERHKLSAQSELGPLVFALSDIVPEWLLALIGPAVLRRQPLVNLAVTNLPGTRDPLFLLGSRMLELYPYVSVTGNVATIIGVLSYEDGLGVGITVDADVVPDVEVLVDGMSLAARALVEREDRAGAVRVRRAARAGIAGSEQS